jgi:hypothetical protein
VLRAFLDLMGAPQGRTTRIDLILEGDERGLVEASRVVSREGGEILGVGTFRAHMEDNPICYLRIRAQNAKRSRKRYATVGSICSVCTTRLLNKISRD